MYNIFIYICIYIFVYIYIYIYLYIYIYIYIRKVLFNNPRDKKIKGIKDKILNRCEHISSNLRQVVDMM